MTNQLFKSHWKKAFVISFFSITTLISSCGGDDGDDGLDGATGAQGEQGGQGAAGFSEIPDTLSGEITAASVTEDGTLSIQFSLKDKLDRGFSGLPASNIRFTVTKLFPEGSTGNGEPSKWQSYINKVEDAPPALDSSDPDYIGPGTADQIQATYEKDGVLSDNLDGSYTYQYSINLNSVGEPLAVSYEPALSHRVAFQISGGDFPAVNADYDWQPSTGETTGISSRNIVSEDTCNQCHGQLALHGGGRIDMNYCVTCHNPGSTDANSGNSVNLTEMAHKIHRGHELQAVIDGGEYAIWGYKDGKHDYSEVAFPQDIRNCQSCHDESNENTADAANWRQRPTMEACGSCHDDVDFSQGIAGGHDGGAQQDNSQCSTCHTNDSAIGALMAHDISGKNTARDNFELQIDGVALAANALDAALTDLTINVTFLDGNGAPITGPVADINFFNAADPKLLYNWIRPTEGYQTNYSQDFMGLDTSSTAIHMATAADSGDVAQGKHQYVVQGLDLASGDSILVTHDILLCVSRNNGTLINCVDSTADVRAANAVTAYFDDAGALLADSPITFGADRDSCNSCHQDLEAHPTPHNHGAEEFDQCRSCHNTNRIAWESGEATDFKSIVHRFHDSNFHGTEVELPDDPSNCQQCHSQYDDDSWQYDLPLKSNIWPESGPNGSTSATVVVCSSCHLETAIAVIDTAALTDLPTADQALIEHMMNNGGIFGGTPEEANKVESCSICHSIGSSAGIDKAHNIR